MWCDVLDGTPWMDRPNASSKRKPKRDALLLAFAEAKLAVVEFDIRDCGLRTSSLHAYEKAISGAGLAAPPLRPLLAPHVTADPNGYCAAVLLPTAGLALLESAQDDALLADGPAGTARVGGAAVIARSYVVELHMLGIQQVRDMAFLHGYAEPAMAMLSEAEPTWSARLAIRRDTCRLTVHSLNMAQRRHPLLWECGDLPSDAQRIVAVPSPINGVIIICAHLVLYRAAGGQVCILVYSL